MKRAFRAVYCTTALTVSAWNTDARAQDQRQEPTAPVGEIIVTAQKREQSINSVGMTIQAATADTLSKRGVKDVSDLVKIVPGFTSTESLYGTPVYTLRGIGLYDTAFAGSPSVAIYTDQVPRNVSVMAGALDLDLERVEVLKGPQGTLFGQSATGGAINYITAKPTRQFEAGTDLSVERFGKFVGSGFVSGPLTDTLSARLAVGATQGGAWQYSISRPSDKNGAVRRQNARLTLHWEPSDRLRLDLSATGSRDRSDGLVYQYTGSRFNIYSNSALATANANPATVNPYARINNVLYDTYTNPSSPGYDSTFLTRQDTLVRRMNGAIPPPPNVPDLAEGARFILSEPLAKSARQADWTPGFSRHNHNNYYQFIANNSFDLTDAISVTSISALAKQTLDYTTDLDATPAHALDQVNAGSVRSFNQEIRLAGKADAINWMVGANYDNVRSTQVDTFRADQYSGSNPLGIYLAYAQVDFTSKAKTYAGYGNAEINLGSGFSVQAGVRYTKNKLRATNCYVDPGLEPVQGAAATFAILSDVLRGLPNGTTRISANECLALGDGTAGTTLFAPTIQPLPLALNQDNWSFRVGLNYKLLSGGLLYATISQGYKSGIFTAIGASTTDQYDPATQEKVIAYEAGAKIPLFDRAVQFNLSSFYYDYSNKQVRARFQDVVFGLLEKLVNVPKSYIWGVEAELTARPIAGLVIGASGTYLKSKVSKEFSTTADGSAIFNTAGFTGDFKGTRLPFTPTFSGSADLQYEWRLGELMPFVGASITYQSGTNATFHNAVLRADEFHIPGYETVDARLGIASSSNRWRISLFGRNILNKYYVTAKSVGLDTNFQTAGRPATYGISLTLRTR